MPESPQVGKGDLAQLVAVVLGQFSKGQLAHMRNCLEWVTSLVGANVPALLSEMPETMKLVLQPLVLAQRLEYECSLATTTRSTTERGFDFGLELKAINLGFREFHRELIATRGEERLHIAAGAVFGEVSDAAQLLAELERPDTLGRLREIMDALPALEQEAGGNGGD